MKIELLWFEDCPCHRAAEALVQGVLDELGIEVPIERIEVPDDYTGDSVRLPGSPTVRVDGVDIQPGFEACPECTPRCRLYATETGLGCLPSKEWVTDAIQAASR